MIAYKIFRLRKDGSLGPLFVNARQRIPMGEWLEAIDHTEDANRKGLAARPGWHCGSTPNIPHLSMKGRALCKVRIAGYTLHHRPASQGGLWYTADHMQVLEIVKKGEAK